MAFSQDIKVLTVAEFTEEKYAKLGFDTAERQKWPRGFNPNHFFNACRQYMNLGLLTVWGCDKAVLGGLFVSNLYSGLPESLILFWWSEPGHNADLLRAAFMEESKRRQVVRVSTSTFGQVRSEAMDRLYRRKGFTPTETIYGQFLN